LGIQNEVVNHHAPPRNLRWLPQVGRIRQEPVEEKHDLGIILDLDSIGRLGSTGEFFRACDRLVVIDHHVPDQAPGDLRIVDTSAPATAVILTRLLNDLGAKITPDMATCLLTGIVTDTGSFRFRNTTPEALHLAAQLIEYGGDIVRVSEEIFQRKSLAGQRLLGRVLDSMRLTAGGRIAWSTINALDFEIAGASDEDTEGFVNELLFVETVQMAAVLREPKPGKIRCSLRSRGLYDVAAVARAFGGGGHINAAGCTLDMEMADAEAAIVAKLERCLASS
ncbi:bifunctional oligoribonuclease/PAP phosphatase NrnA, partial [bacterium]